MRADLPAGAETDGEILALVATGDEAAFARLYDRFAPPLYSLVFRILNDAKESEDVLQEGFVQIWNRAPKYDASRSSPFTWSVIILRSKAIDRLRARQRQFRLIEAAAPEAEIARETAETSRSVHNDERSQVVWALGQLGEEQRQAIELAFFGGLTQVEISGRLGEPLGTVKARIRRGLLRLREFLGEPP